MTQYGTKQYKCIQSKLKVARRTWGVAQLKRRIAKLQGLVWLALLVWKMFHNSVSSCEPTRRRVDGVWWCVSSNEEYGAFSSVIDPGALSSWSLQAVLTIWTQIPCAHMWRLKFRRTGLNSIFFFLFCEILNNIHWKTGVESVSEISKM